MSFYIQFALQFAITQDLNKAVLPRQSGFHQKIHIDIGDLSCIGQLLQCGRK